MAGFPGNVKCVTSCDEIGDAPRYSARTCMEFGKPEFLPLRGCKALCVLSNSKKKRLHMLHVRTNTGTASISPTKITLLSLLGNLSCLGTSQSVGMPAMITVTMAGVI